jgi:hypothetical protein
VRNIAIVIFMAVAPGKLVYRRLFDNSIAPPPMFSRAPPAEKEEGEGWVKKQR